MSEATPYTEAQVADPKILLGHHLKKLKLPTILAEYDRQAQQCAEQGIDHPRYLLRLVELELIERQRKMIERRIRTAKFPATKSLDSFDFKALPELNKVLVVELARAEFITRRENIIAARAKRDRQDASRYRFGSCCLPERYHRRLRDRCRSRQSI